MQSIISSVVKFRRGKDGKYEDLSRLDQDDDAELESPSDNSQLYSDEIKAKAARESLEEGQFTVEQAIDAIGFGRFQVKLSLLAGLAWMADAMEMMILSILSPALHCEWGLLTWQQAFITTLVFLGMMCGSSFWGFVCDIYGRKGELILSALFTFYFGLLSAFAPTLIWMLILRCIVGFGIGGAPQAVTLYSEFLPSKHRAKCVVLIELAWAIGAMFEVVLALLVMPRYGWRLLLALSAIPLFIFAVTCAWLPESARYHFACNEPEKVMKTLQRVAADNRSALPPGKLIASNKIDQRGRIQDLFMPELLRTTLLLWFIWFANAFSYYGIVLFSTVLFEMGDNCHAYKTSSEICKLDCHLLSTNDYTDLLWTTVAEFPGLFITVLIIERLGRKITMAVEFLIFSISTLVLIACISSRISLTIVLFIARAFISGAFQGAYVYTPEVYPTTMRAIGLGSCSTMARIGAIITPFIAQVLVETSPYNPPIVYGVIGVLAAGACMLLPIETKGRVMKDSVGH